MTAFELEFPVKRVQCLAGQKKMSVFKALHSSHTVNETFSKTQVLSLTWFRSTFKSLFLFSYKCAR